MTASIYEMCQDTIRIIFVLLCAGLSFASLNLGPSVLASINHGRIEGLGGFSVDCVEKIDIFLYLLLPSCLWIR